MVAVIYSLSYRATNSYRRRFSSGSISKILQHLFVWRGKKCD